jgi:hypothetical protein
MKPRRSREQGNVLVVGLFTAAVVGLALMSYLSLVSNQNTATQRSQAWNAALPIVEAGLEEALAHLHSDKGNLGCCGWSLVGSNYTYERTLGDGYFNVGISTNRHPHIISQGFTKIPLTASYLSRTVQVACSNAWGAGLLLKRDLDLNGNDIAVDSFDSSNPLYSTNGLYIASKRKDGVWVVSQSGIKDTLDVGNADIWGTASTAPGGTVRVGPSGSLGSMGWHNAGHTGVEPGAFTDDANVTIPPAPAPPGGAMAPGGGCKVGTKNYTYCLGSGVYQLANWTAPTYVGGHVTLIVSGSIKLGGGDVLMATNARLTIFCSGSVQLGGTPIINGSGVATNLTLYGTPTCTSITFNGGSTFIGKIHAPDADIVAGGGGGGTPLHFCGSVTARSLTMNGRISFHYDEALAAVGRKYTIIAWNEL